MREGIGALLVLAGMLLTSGWADAASRSGDLLGAAAAGDVAGVRSLLDAGIEVNALDKRGRSALWRAAENGQLEVASVLIAAGADPRRKSLDGHSVLVAAAASGHSELVALLGEQPGVWADGGQVSRAVVVAAKRSHAGLAKSVYGHLAEPGRLAAAAVDDAERIRALRGSGPVGPEVEGDLTPLTLAARLGHEASVAALLDTLDEGGGELERARGLEVAIVAGQAPVVERMLSRGVEPNAFEGAALRTAVGEEHVEAVRLLLRAGADPSLGSPLILMDLLRNPEIVRLLLEAGADPNVSGEDGIGALNRAIARGQVEIARLLLEAGADPGGRDASGLTPAAHAFTEPGMREIASLLYERLDERVSLSDAAAAGDLARVQALIDDGAELTPKGQRASPLALAALCGRSEIARTLMEAGAALAPQPGEEVSPLLAAALSGNRELVQAMATTAASRTPPESLQAEEAALAAAEADRMDAAVLLLEGIADPDRVLPGGDTLVLAASKVRKADLLDALLAGGGDPNVRTPEGSTPLVQAAVRSTPQIVSRLIDAGAELEARDASGTTALMAAARGGRAANVKALLDAGAEPAAALPLALQSRKLQAAELLYEAVGSPMLEAAIVLGRVDDAGSCLAQGADPNARDAEGLPMLSLAASLGHTSTVKLLAEAGAEVDGRGEDGRTALMWASRRPDIEGVVDLIELGADVELRDTKRWTALFHAAYKGQADVVRALLAAGANPGVAIDQGQHQGRTPLITAAQRGHVDVVQMLHAAGVGLRAEERNGGTALIAAAERGREDLARWILERLETPSLCELLTVGEESHVMKALTAGADPNQRQGHVPILIYATTLGRLEVVRELLERGADVDGANTQGWNALMTASGRGHPKIVDLLLEAGADLAATDDRGWTALMAAANQGKLGAVERLLAAGADPQVKNSKGQTALDLAKVKKRGPVVTRLEETP